LPTTAIHDSIEVKTRHFCVVPPEPVLNYFSTLSTFSNDEIEGHMHIFSKEKNQDIYKDMLKEALEKIQEALKHVVNRSRTL
jgi:hypothetical protein